ncbi:MAG TPA: hypothetical protein VGO93_00745 [Candidatus Xenobia bacterium]
MPLRDSWQTRIKAVDRQFAAVQLAVSRLLEEGRRNPTILKCGVQHRDVVNAAKDLEGTCIIRLFAEFESGLRQYWETIALSHPKTKDLLDSLAARCRIGNDQRDNAHPIREYRNSLVHEREDEEVAPVPIAEARGYLCTFFSFLPRQW